MTDRPKAKLTQSFLDRVAATGLTDSAVAAAIGISRQFYHQVKTGQEQPTTRFMIGAVRAGLANNFAEVAEPIDADGTEVAA